LGIGRRRAQFLWGMLLLYAIARICQLYAGRLPTLLIVILHVVPPALFALAHGSVLYGARGISVFAIFCLGFGTIAESVSLRTGFPFGHYYFTDVMGPKVFQLPLLLALAYLGIGYVAWILALLILGDADKPIHGTRVLAPPDRRAIDQTRPAPGFEPADGSGIARLGGGSDYACTQCRAIGQGIESLCPCPWWPSAPGVEAGRDGSRIKDHPQVPPLS